MKGTSNCLAIKNGQLKSQKEANLFISAKDMLDLETDQVNEAEKKDRAEEDEDTSVGSPTSGDTETEMAIDHNNSPYI